jgi:hypothetical protein
MTPKEQLLRRYMSQPHPRFTIVQHNEAEGIRCHGCNRISWQSQDIEHRFCPCLHLFHDDVVLDELIAMAQKEQ